MGLLHGCGFSATRSRIALRTSGSGLAGDRRQRNLLGILEEASMKKLLAAGAAAFALWGAPALAADMPARAPVYKATAPAHYDPWTGFYVGGSIGARWSDVDWRADPNNSTFGFFTGPGNPASLDSTNVRLGGYLGYNWRIAPS
jgi:outer membrane immunogenic protein